MGTGIFLIASDNSLVQLSPAPYARESSLQEYLALHPELLAGDQISPADPRRWLLISRELGVPAEEDGGDRWSLDHLFLDQDAVPTFVEVKRSTDTRIRREVVGQMLDYAANGVKYWPADRIRSQFEEQQKASGREPAESLAEFLGPDRDQEEFWKQVKTNLQAGWIRMIFVADVVPAELKRVVEFLNEQMDPAEVLAVEIPQYVSGTFRGLVPRLVGQTEEAKQRKAASPGQPSRQWDESSFFQELTLKHGSEAAAVARRVLDWGREKGARIAYGKGVRDGSFTVTFVRDGVMYYPFTVWTNGFVQVQFGVLSRRPAFSGDESRNELRRQLNEIPGVRLPEETITKMPSIPIRLLESTTAVDRFLRIADWVLSTIGQDSNPQLPV